MKLEKDRYIKQLMERYNVYNERDLAGMLTYKEYDKLIELELISIRGA